MDNFILGDTVELKFKLNITGTSLKPSKVFAVLGDKVSLRFEATPADEDYWCATITPVASVIHPGETTLCLEVILNDRLHTVLKRNVMISDIPKIDVTLADQHPVLNPEIATNEPVVTKADDAVIDLTKSVDESIVLSEPLITATPIKKITKSAPINVSALVENAKADKKIELDFKTLVTSISEQTQTATVSKEIPATVLETTTNKIPFAIKKGKIITK